MPACRSRPPSSEPRRLLHGPAATDLPVVLVGDLNSPGDGSGVTYNDVIAAGLADAAIAAGVGSAPTCCQAADLLNPASLLDRRVDFVLFRGAFSVRDADIVGDNPADRTPSGLWPSDHAGVAATRSFRTLSPSRSLARSKQTVPSWCGTLGG